MFFAIHPFRIWTLLRLMNLWRQGSSMISSLQLFQFYRPVFDLNCLINSEVLTRCFMKNTPISENWNSWNDACLDYFCYICCQKGTNPSRVREPSCQSLRHLYWWNFVKLSMLHAVFWLVLHYIYEKVLILLDINVNVYEEVSLYSKVL